MLIFCCNSRVCEDEREIITPATVDTIGEANTPKSSRYMLNDGDVTGIDNSGMIL